MSAVWEVAQLVFAVVGILTTVALVTFLAIVAADSVRPVPPDEWDGQNDPEDDGTDVTTARDAVAGFNRVLDDALDFLDAGAPGDATIAQRVKLERLRDGTWLESDTEFVNEAARWRRGNTE